MTTKLKKIDYKKNKGILKNDKSQLEKTDNDNNVVKQTKKTTKINYLSRFKNSIHLYNISTKFSYNDTRGLGKVRTKIKSTYIKKKYLIRLRRIYKFSLNYKIFKAFSLISNKFIYKINIRITQNNIFSSFLRLSDNKILHFGSSGIYRMNISKRRLKHVYQEYLKRFFSNVKKNSLSFNNVIINIISPSKKFRKIIISYIKTYVKNNLKSGIISSKIKKNQTKFLKLKQKLVFLSKKKKNIILEQFNSLSNFSLDNKIENDFFNLKCRKFNNWKINSFKLNDSFRVVLNIIPKKCFNGCRVNKKIKKKRKYNRIFK